MKKKILSIAIVCSSAFSTFSQISITLNDLPSEGTSYIMLEDKNIQEFPVTAASGQAQAWDYASAFIHHDTLGFHFVKPSVSPYSSSFPNANLGIEIKQENGFIFYRKDNSGLYMDAMHYTDNGWPVFVLDYAPDDQLLVPVPFTYGNTRNAHSEFIITPDPALKIEVKSDAVFTADAFGSIKTPAGQYANTLRIKTYITYTTGVYAFFNGQFNLVQTSDSSSTDYNWYANGYHSAVVSANADHTGKIKRASFLFKQITGLREFSDNLNINVYPNPSSGILSVGFDKDETGTYMLTLFSAEGKQCLSEKVTVERGGIFPLDLTSLDCGFYYLQLKHADGSDTRTVKVQLIK